MRSGISTQMNLMLLQTIKLLDHGELLHLKLMQIALWTQEDSDDGDLPDDKEVGDVKTEGLKTQLIRTIKQQASGLLAPTDWYVVKASEVSDYSVPTNIATYRASVRTKSNEMETAITNASDTPALETLYTYTDR